MYAHHRRHDVVVVGARAAGGATALLLARLGHDVVVVDRATLPSDTISTHQIARSGVVQLHRWGLLDDVVASGAPPIRQVSFTSGGETVTRAVKHKAGVDHLIAPRRYALDAIVTRAAQQAGADVHTGIAISGVRRDDRGRASGVYGVDQAGAAVEISARFVVGADGLQSRVANSVGSEVVEHRGNNGATQYAYFAGLPWPGIEFYVEDGSLAGVFPTNNGEACVWVCTSSNEARRVRRDSRSRTEAFARLLFSAAPSLSERLRGARRTSAVSGMLHAPNQLRRATGPGWALVGDASHHRDPVTGHGLSDAYRDAELLASALDAALRGDCDDAMALATYQDERDQALREIFELTCALSSYPPVAEFVELQKRLSAAIEAEAATLAARPFSGACPLACSARAAV